MIYPIGNELTLGVIGINRSTDIDGFDTKNINLVIPTHFPSQPKICDVVDCYIGWNVTEPIIPEFSNKQKEKVALLWLNPYYVPDPRNPNKIVTEPRYWVKSDIESLKKFKELKTEIPTCVYLPGHYVEKDLRPFINLIDIPCVSIYDELMNRDDNFIFSRLETNNTVYGSGIKSVCLDIRDGVSLNRLHRNFWLSIMYGNRMILAYNWSLSNLKLKQQLIELYEHAKNLSHFFNYGKLFYSYTVDSVKSTWVLDREYLNIIYKKEFGFQTSYGTNWKRPK